MGDSEICAEAEAEADTDADADADVGELSTALTTGSDDWLGLAEGADDIDTEGFGIRNNVCRYRIPTREHAQLGEQTRKR